MQEVCGEEGVLADLLGDSGKLTKKVVADRLNAVRAEANGPESDDVDERSALEDLASALARVESARNTLKTRRSELEGKVADAYAELGQEEIVNLVIQGKWLKRLRDGVDALAMDIQVGLRDRIVELGRRYGPTLSDLELVLQVRRSAVQEEFAKMGLLS